MLAVFTLLIIIFILVLVRLELRWKSNNYPPGPFQWPIIGNQSLLKSLARNLGGQHLAFLELNKRYGSDVITLRLGTNNLVVVSGNKHLHSILSNESYDYRPWNTFIKIRNMGLRKGVTMNDGQEWREIRSWMVRTFRTVGFGKHAMSDLITDELTVILKKLKDGGVHRMKTVIAPAVINVLWTLATGKQCDTSRLQRFIDLMDRRARAFDMSGGLLATFPWIRYIAPNRSGYNILVALNNDLRTLLQETIKEHKQNYVAGSETDLIDMFLREMFNNKEDNNIFTDDQLMMILADLFIAGCSTTTATLTFLFVNMCVHQEVQEKLHEEIDSVIPSDQLPGLDYRPKLPYTEAVLTESQRMFTVTPVIGPRRVTQDTSLDSYTIPKDTTVLLNVYSVHMDANLYPDPYTFKPERFIKNGVYEADENILAFGKGRRRCPGEVLARSALFLLFVGVMQKFRFLPVPGKGPTKVVVNPGLTLSPKYDEMLLVPR